MFDFLETVAWIVDMVLTLVGAVLAFWFYLHGDTGSGIFWILIALFFGRGQVANVK